MSQRTLNVLFVCDGDPARALIAQALLERFGGERFAAFSASSDPRARIDPLAIEMLNHHGFHLGELRGGRWIELGGNSTPRLDFVIGLSERPEVTAQCPAARVSATWRITDPSAEQGDIGQRRIAMRRAFRELETRIKLFALLRHESAGPVHAV